MYVLSHQAYIYTCTTMYARMHIYINICPHTYIYTYIYIRAPSYVYAYMSMPIHIYIDTHVHAPDHVPRGSPAIYTYMSTYQITSLEALWPCIHTYVYIPDHVPRGALAIYTYMSMSTCICIHTRSRPSRLCGRSSRRAASS